MFCSDDKHPDELELHHINELVKRSLKLGYDLYDVLRAACVNPVLHYKLPVGLLRVNDAADFIVIDNTDDFTVLETWIDGRLVAEHGQSLIAGTTVEAINNFEAGHVTAGDFEIWSTEAAPMLRVIEAIEGQLVTRCLELPALVAEGCIISDTERDLLKIAVINRYERKAPVAVGFIRNFGLKRGALASTIAHDCHNLIVVGADDAAMCAAVNALVDCKGGIAVATGASDVAVMPLPVAGLMSVDDGHEVASEYTRLDRLAKGLGTPMHAPFMTLSFMALLVIPALKLSDKGLFDGAKFEFTSLVR
jgi:adenine deaminase